MAVAGIIVIVIILVALVSIFRKNEKEKADELEMEKRLADEHIYDRETGAKMTLEQAENGYLVKPELYSLRVKTDEEIENNYGDEEKGLEYIRRHFIKKNIPELEDRNEIEDLLLTSGMSRQYENFNIHELWKLQDNVYIALIHIDSRYVTGTFHDTQLGIVLNRESLHHHKLQDRFKDFDYEYVDDWVILKSPGTAQFKDFKLLVDKLGNK